MYEKPFPSGEVNCTCTQLHRCPLACSPQNWCVPRLIPFYWPPPLFPEVSHSTLPNTWCRVLLTVHRENTLEENSRKCFSSFWFHLIFIPRHIPFRQTGRQTCLLMSLQTFRVQRLTGRLVLCFIVILTHVNPLLLALLPYCISPLSPSLALSPLQAHSSIDDTSLAILCVMSDACGLLSVPSLLSEKDHINYFTLFNCSSPTHSLAWH